MEVEAQFRRDIGVGHLFMGQHDVEADGTAARLGRAAIAGLHHAGAAARDDDILGALACDRAFGDEPRKAARLVVILRHGMGGAVALRLGAGDARAAKKHHGRADAARVKLELGFQEFELQPHGAQFIAEQKIGVGKSQPVGGRFCLCGVRGVTGGFEILLGVAERSRPGVFGHILSSCTGPSLI